MKRIVVTGSKGGTGRSIVNVLREHGYDVLGLDVKPVEADDIGYVQADLGEDPGLHDLLTGAWGLVHFGSLPTDETTSRSQAFRNLMLGGFNVLQACANLGIQRIAYASSITVYGAFAAHAYLPVDELSPLAPAQVYSSAKVMLEQLSTDMCRWHSLSIAALRLGRIVYEGSFEQRLKRHTESDASAASVLWSYVDARDVAEACRLWLESEVQGFRAFNVAADDVCVITPTRELLRRFYPKISNWKTAFEAHESPFSSASLRAGLGWKAKFNWQALRDGA